MHLRVLHLNGTEWQLGQSAPERNPFRASWEECQQIGDWIPAVVPGNVRADLVRAGRLRELCFAQQSREAHWVDDHCWWLIRSFALSHAEGERVHLVLRGVDYISDLFLNGHHLAHHEGMFSPQIHEITHLLRPDNRLAVRILGSAWLPNDRSSIPEKALNIIEARFGGLSSSYPQRRDTVKCQMGFGWDFSPPLRTMGIWDDVFAILSGAVLIRDVTSTTTISHESAVVEVGVELDAGTDQRVGIRCTLAGETFDCPAVATEQVVELPAGVSRHALRLPVANPNLWWPWDHGRPDLYRLTIEVLDGARILDAASHCIGLRQVELSGRTLYVNGHRVYARGANWVPASILPGCVGASDYESLLRLARQANMNMLRVWGGGLREKRAFYDLCDRLGILLWQEFPFACAFLTRYPRSASYLDQVESEARAIVRDIRHHASVVLWCGGNEFSPERNQPLVAALSAAVADEDPSRPFLAASPANGDSHNWNVWHRFHPPSAYRRDGARFASELGLQAPPDATALSRFLPAEHLWPPGPSWSHHGAGLHKLWRYARPFLASGEVTLESFVLACQRAQANGLQIAIEHFRRQKANGNGGILVWQLNEPWPAISWALVDHYLQAKPAYEVVQRLFSPILVSLEYTLQRYGAGDTFQARVWIINDTAQALPDCQLDVVLWDGQSRVAEHNARSLVIPADSAATYDLLAWRLPRCDEPRLSCLLTTGLQTLSTNEYDLSIHDDIRPSISQRVRAWLSGLVTAV